MSSTLPEGLLRVAYEHAVQRYLHSLLPNRGMEATPQATQRKITLESLDLVHARRPEVQLFNELLVQYPLPRGGKRQQVVPDNMVVVWPEPIEVTTSYDLPFQPTRPFWMLEYVTRNMARKNYEENFQKYEHELRVPYHLLFFSDAPDLMLFRHNKRRYVSVKPNRQGRLALKELELEMALVDDWVRFWFRGELLPLPAELLHELEEVRSQMEEERRGRLAAEQRLQVTEQRLEAMESQLAAAQRQLEQERLSKDEEIARLLAQLEQRAP
jgi:Uma2 family endonuclease